MIRAKLACIASAASLLPLTAAGTATATASTTQAIGQSAESHQVAGSAAGSVQVAPTNRNISVRIGSPGNDGAVTQTNASSAASAAGNSNTTSQTAAQSGGVAQQAIGQNAENAQAALSTAKSLQAAPTNENISVRIHSPGDNGPVTQSNTSAAQSAAGNDNATTQSAAQGGHGGALQEIGQGASNAQAAESTGASLQDHPVNTNTPVRIHSPGSGGPVRQSNESSATSAAGNHNSTTQSAEQSAGASPLTDRTCDACGHGRGSVVQAIGQDAVNAQLADSAALSLQLAPANTNAGSGGGSVDQRNTSDAASSAGNENATTQSAAQVAGRTAANPSRVVDACERCGGPTVQAIGQSVANRQAAHSAALSKQVCPLNENAWHGAAMAREHGHGHMLRRVLAAAAVTQLNRSSAMSASGNENTSGQEAGQEA